MPNDYTKPLRAADMPTGIDAAKIGAGAVSNTEFGYLDGVTSAIQTQLTGKQPAATGTPNGSKYLRDDNSWQAVSATVTAVACAAKVGTDQAISSNTYTEVGFTSEFFDTNTIHDNSTNNHRFTVPASHGGKWRLVCNLQVTQSNNLAPLEVQVTKNGTRTYPFFDDAWAATPHSFTVSLLLDLAAGDYVSVQVRCGTSAFTVKADTYAYFERIGA